MPGRSPNPGFAVHRAANPGFRSTPLREGRPAKASTIASALAFRSTPLREGRPALAGGASNVSIHAPARGATGPSRRASVSIHAPARGATRADSSRAGASRRFDPRPCARGDVTGDKLNNGNAFRSTPLREGRQVNLRGHRRTVQGVSIHAPARGATGEALIAEATARVSIHAPARGATRCTWK